MADGGANWWFWHKMLTTISKNIFNSHQIGKNRNHLLRSSVSENILNFWLPKLIHNADFCIYVF